MTEVAVLMSTYNGEKYLIDQINSILAQEQVSVSVFIRDDGSTDGTRDILNRLNVDNVHYLADGENLGYKDSFLTLIKYATQTDEFDYFAFADQDDIWLPQKLSKAISKLKDYGNGYSVYYSALQFVDSNLRPLYKKEYDSEWNYLESAFVRFSISGATMVFSKMLAKTFSQANCPHSIGEGHDSLIYRLNLALGGKVLYSDDSYIMFRRHDSNESSGGDSLIKKIQKDFKKKDKNTESNTATWILENFREILPDKEAETLRIIAAAKTSFKARVRILFNSKFRRESLLMNMVFIYKLMTGYI